VSFARVIVLTIGPVLIIAGCYWLTMAGRGQAALSRPSTPEVSAEEPTAAARELTSLPAACRVRADELAALLTADFHLIIRPPYVIAGNLSASELERHYRETIRPTADVLARCYFERRPDAPIAILLFADNASYREFSREFDGQRRDAYSGYYERADRRIMVNVQTGNGTLAHELTHALAHFDFPDMPEWFDEGLASLHEQAEFSPDGRRLVGAVNWRRYHLLYALRTGRLRPIAALMATGRIREGHEAVDYAHARYFCMFLQSQNQLIEYYRAFRDNVRTDPTGLATLCRLFNGQTPTEIDTQFRHWVLTACSK